jgi:tetratricopeptide (TPR) repeat protein
MISRYKFFLIILITINLFNSVLAQEEFFEQAKTKYNEKNLEDSKFLFQRNIVFNPKDAKSYLYLAKIYNAEKNQLEEEKNLNTTLLLEPSNEEAMLMLIKIELKKSNYSKVSELSKAFELVCTKFCKDLIEINENLKDIETKNDS